MKRYAKASLSVFGLILIIIVGCKKETDSNIIAKEDPLKIETNIDSITYNTSDTLPLTIRILSTIPRSGVRISLVTNWKDSSKQIFKLDTSITQPIFSYGLPGHNGYGKYNLSIQVTSLSLSVNTITKSIEFINDPLKRFEGYKVNDLLKSKNEVTYWRDCGVVWDVIAYKFLRNLNNEKWDGFMPQLITGDFNKDGWIDVFNPGIGTFNGQINDKFQWLIWDTTNKTFDNRNLLNDKSFSTFGGNQRRTISIDLNKDGFTDNVIIDHGDDIIYSLPRQPLRIMLSDGKGGYDLKDIKINEKLGFFHSGDVGDLNNDGLLDLVVAAGDQIIIAWGDNTSNYFGGIKRSYFNLYEPSDNGFGEWFPEIAGQSWNVTIGDINKDGWNDLIVGSNEDYSKTTSKYELTTKIVLNQGGGKFNRDGFIPLPANWRMKNNTNNYFLVNDFRILDINEDGLNDIVATASFHYDDFTFFTYMQKSTNSFVIDTTTFVYTINTNRASGNYGSSWKPWIILYDFNKDGKSDVSYIDPHNYWNNSLSKKSVFIRNGSKFIEENFYKYDPFANSIKP